MGYAGYQNNHNVDKTVLMALWDRPKVTEGKKSTASSTPFST